MHDGVDLPILEHPSGMQTQRNRCTRWLALAHEHGLLGNREMHARTLHRADGGDRAREFALHGLLVTRFLDHLAGAETGILLHQLEAHTDTVRQALARQLHADLLELGRRHHQHAAGLVDAIRHAGLLQGLHDLTRVLFIEIRVQRRKVGRLRPQHDRDAKGDACGDTNHDRKLAQPGVVRDRAHTHIGCRQPAPVTCFGHGVKPVVDSVSSVGGSDQTGMFITSL